jgi:hypothetical protein
MRVMSVGAGMAFTDRVALGELTHRYGMEEEAVVTELRRLATL